MEHKYLSDGRKVAIVGKLNNNETIVQEIFVTTEGDEVPSGERFVTKSLHDTPVISYAEKEKKKLEVVTERIKADQERMRRETAEIQNKLYAHRDLLKNIPKISSLMEGDELDTFVNFLSGTIEWLVVDSYSLSPPVKFIDEMIYWKSGYEECQYDHIKLLSVAGKSNGEISYRIYRYSDGSGNSSECHPFMRYEDAIEHIKNRAIKLIGSGNLSDKDYEVCLSLDIEFSKEHVAAFFAKEKQKVLNSIEYNEKSIAKDNERLDKLREKLSAIDKALV